MSNIETSIESQSLETLFTVGPVQMSDSVLEIGRQPLPYFRTPQFSEIIIEVCENLKYLVSAPGDSECLLLSCSGTGAMEATIQNLFTDTDRVLIVDGGTFGRRFVEICEVLHIPHEVIKVPPGQSVNSEMLEPYLQSNINGVLVNSHETSTGTLHDIAVLSEFCTQKDCLFVVDAISSFLADNLDMVRDKIDAVILSSQKALALPPGLSMVLLSERSIHKISKKRDSSIYFSFKKCLQDIKRGQTPFTPAVGIVIQLHKRLSEVREQGVESIIASVSELAMDFRRKIDFLKIKTFSRNPSNCLTSVALGSDKNAYHVYEQLKDRFRLIVNPNGGGLREKIFRVGHIGELNFEDNERLFTALMQLKEEGAI